MTHSWFGCRRGEVPSHQVRVARRARVRPGGADPLSAPDTLDPSGAHQPGDLVPADVVPGAAGGLPQLAGTVDPVVVLPQLAVSCGPSAASRCGPGRRWPGLGRVVGARSDLHLRRGRMVHDRLDPEARAVGVDERDYLLCWRSSSAPKKLAARFRISLARFSSRFSCSSSAIRCASAVLTPRVPPVVDVGLPHPGPHRLGAVPELAGDPLHRAVLGAQLGAQRAAPSGPPAPSPPG